MKMLKTMRWFGPNDPISLLELRQAGCEGIVTALHHIPIGEIWTKEEILERKQLIEREHLSWSVVESLPVHEEIKRGGNNRSLYIENYKTSIQNLAAAGIQVITYNFMPVLDWIRTDHQYRNPDGSYTLAFDLKCLAAFDLYLLKRPGAGETYTADVIKEATAYFESLTESQRTQLARNVLLGLPGSSDHFTTEALLTMLQDYKGIDEEVFRQNLIHFLNEVTPVAAECGSFMAIHPDDPPFSLLGLPRIMSTMNDAERIFSAVPSAANGLCFCSGSFGAHPENSLTDIFDAFQERIHFIHLRNVIKTNRNNFRESAHLEGDNPMAEIVERILLIMQKRNIQLAMRPDHGFLYETDRHKNAYPGYSLVGRMKGLAEISGLENGILFNLKKQRK